MKTVLTVLFYWFIVSIPVGIICGKLLRKNQKYYPPSEKEG